MVLPWLCKQVTFSDYGWLLYLTDLSLEFSLAISHFSAPQHSPTHDIPIYLKTYKLNPVHPSSPRPCHLANCLGWKDAFLRVKVTEVPGYGGWKILKFVLDYVLASPSFLHQWRRQLQRNVVCIWRSLLITSYILDATSTSDAMSFRSPSSQAPRPGLYPDRRWAGREWPRGRWELGRDLVSSEVFGMFLPTGKTERAFSHSFPLFSAVDVVDWMMYFGGWCICFDGGVGGVNDLASMVWGCPHMANMSDAGFLWQALTQTLKVAINVLLRVSSSCLRINFFCGDVPLASRVDSPFSTKSGWRRRRRKRSGKSSRPFSYAEGKHLEVKSL